MISSIQTRLLLAVSVLAIAAVAAVALTARQSTRQEFERFQSIQRVHESDDVEGTLDRVVAAIGDRCCDSSIVANAARSMSQDQALLIFDKDRALIAATGAGVQLGHVTATYNDGLLTLDSREKTNGAQTGVLISIKGGAMRPFVFSDGTRGTAHIVPMPGHDRDQPAQQFLGSVDRRLVIATIAVAMFALLITWAITRRIVGPIAELRDATRDLAAGQLSRRVTSTGSDEVADLARGFNQMASALERQEELRRNLVHDVAHELRTPLTALRCRVETVLDGMVADPKPALAQINEEVAHLSQLVSDLEELARAEARDLQFAITRVDVGDVCRSAIRVAGLDGDTRIRVQIDDALTAHADAVRLRQIVLNLLTNADRHTPADGVITVRARAQHDAATVSVSNTGSALTTEQLERVFDRFYRADASRQRATGGSGLGLAIVKQLAEAQGGKAWADRDATGVTFSVSVPLAVR